MIRVHRASVEDGQLKLSAYKNYLLSRAASSILILRLAALALAGTIAVAAPAEATVYWSDYDGGFSGPAPMAPPRAQRAQRHSGKKIDKPAREAARPQGPLIIAISINKQHLKIYDTNGFFAETPISTGMHGHSTPMGVFSVIQKQKFHQSNIYSGAPMPFMQRITWSGIAMHAGVLPGYPASHGCIRMPMAFAVKMYGWTRMGARVVVTPGEMTPASFSHPLLATQKIVPQPVAADVPKPEAEAKSDKVASTGLTNTPAIPEASLELRSTVGHDGHLQTAMDEPPALGPLNEQTHTADAGASPAIKSAVTMSDATPASADASRGDNVAIAVPPAAADAVKIDVSTTDTATPGKKPGENVAATADIPANTADAKKDQPGMFDAEKAAAPKPAPVMAAEHKRSGPISVFVSRKDSKLYVRQDFAPLFDVPVTIAPSDRPLGTHIFTAEADKNDANILHWSVVSLPTRNVARRDDDERETRRRKIAGAVEIKPIPEPDSPAEALDRLTIPPDAMARITESLSTGSSIIVSDQGIAAGETGEGTDFIVSLR
ncbi:Lipoprotein-anchoring transpeptidase ErfK/SrfK [Bradyrhizobium canariense]|uniref:Lipoprotein-anchoring transpeptidase ErfK/SrfK n=1 Tax=Bradyrhizobium canariense TaxID=255045 RepID=A0A1H1RCW9_9BRAD|nr:Lipoprotein-anchoring transpeptidase ErfK/SrfK [Bradyrhizobium canariense]